ncbi:unnamed protein product [Rhodiola kirilowii]
MQHQMTNPSGFTFPTEPLTTEQIQKLLDENKQLIMMILENQNLGKLAECAQYQALLQKNLMYLAAIADAQPQAGLSQTPMQPAPQQGHFIQHPQHMMTQQQPNMFASKMPVQVNHQMQLIQPSMQQQQQQQQQQFFPGHLGPRPVIQTPMHQMSPSGIVDPGSFSNALRSKQSYSGAFEGDIQGRQFGGEN